MRYQHICPQCGTQYETSDGTQVCCSRSCAKALRRARADATRQARFWARVDRSGGPDACWPYQGNTQKGGYGRFAQELTHRMAYTYTHGTIPDGLWVLHRCDNRPCCNPQHLYVGTIQDNNADRVNRGRTAKNPHYGEDNGLAKLTEDQVRAIRRERAAGVTLRELVERYGTTEANISSVARRKLWKHVV